MAKKPVSAEILSMKKRLMSSLIERESTPIRVAPRITALREALSLDKAQFADSIEYDRSTLSKVEAGKVGLDLAVGERIAALYGVGLDYIYRGDLSDLPSDLRSRVMEELVTAKSLLAAR